MTNLENIRVAPVGERQDSAITEIKEGVQEDFRSESYWASTDLSKQEIAEAKKKAAIEIVCDNGASLVVNLPSGETAHPKSTLGKFAKTYGSMPKVGLKVSTKMDTNGFYRVVIEE